MPITEPIKQFFMQKLPGMNNIVEPFNLKEKWVSLAQNCRFEPELGAVDKRDPVSFFNTSSIGVGPVTGLYRFYTSTGSISFVSVHGTSVYVGDDSAGTWAPIRTSISQGKRMSFETYKDLLYMSNGLDEIFVYDGSADNVTWEMGSCKAILGSSAGLLDQDTYTYRITFDTDAYVNGATSNAITCDGSFQQIELSQIPLGPLGTVNRKIYRTNGGGASYFLIAEILDNIITVYTDNIADSDTTVLTTGTRGDPYPSVTDVQPKGSILKLHRERLFITGDFNSPSRIYYSNVFLPHYIQQTSNSDFIDIAPEDNDEIMGIPIQLGVMVCIKKNTLRKLHVTAANSGASPETWYADDPLSFIGTPAQWSITQTPYGIAFLGWDHWYMFDGGSLKEIIDEFDTRDILPSAYSDVVGFYHKGVMLAAYADLTNASQSHDRIMRYNFRRQALGIDLWTSDTISGANVFAAKTGDDETGELYYGDAENGYILKAKDAEESYRLRTKTEANEGTKTTTFVGGTENNPYIEIGAITSAQLIPDDLIIFWDSEITNPGAGWVEITGTYDGRFIKIGAISAVTAAAATHTHPISGSTSQGIPDVRLSSGDQAANTGVALYGHTHTFSGTSDAESSEPRNMIFRVFKSVSATTTEFPTGSIIMYDQAETPEGWFDVSVGNYVKIGSTGVGVPNDSSHSHTYDIQSSTWNDPRETGSGSAKARSPHYHQIAGETSSKSLNDWELKNVGLHFIKKIGESDTWDGSSKLAYCLVEGVSTPTGWVAVNTYDGDDRYIKTGTDVPTTQEASGADHDHGSVLGDSATNSHFSGGLTNSRTMNHQNHYHPYTGTVASGTAGEPANVEFRLFSFILGKMADYNDAIETQYTAGTWEAPPQNINAESMAQMFWNEDIDDVVNDDIIFHTRSGVSEAACLAAPYSVGLTDPNGSDIVTVADNWFQYKIEFTALDTILNNPRVFFSNAYVVRYTYEKGDVIAETAVNWVYSIGLREFDTPLQDKSFKKFHTIHEGLDGTLNIKWTTNNNTNDFMIDISAFPRRWESYFQDTAIGREINFTLSKNDLCPFRLSEIKGIYSEFPGIL